MTLFNRISSLVKNLFRKNRVERDLDEEVLAHLEMLVDEKIAAGLSPVEARRAALIELGGLEQVKEKVRDVRAGMFLERLGQDLRYGSRMLRKHPGFTSVAVLTLALGIGVNTAVFTMFDLWFRPLPVKDPATVVNLSLLERGQEERTSFPYPDYAYLREHAQVFSGLIASTWDWAIIMGGQRGGQSASEETQKIFGQFVSDNFFSALRVNTALGRAFTPEENGAPGQQPVAVLSYDFWQGHFGGDLNILGRTIHLNGHSFVIIGVAERGFRGLTFGQHALDVWLPLMMTTQMFPQNDDWFAARNSKWVRVAGRLKPDRTLEDARAEMTVLLSEFVRAHPEMEPKTQVRVLPGTMFGQLEWASMGVILAATTLVLLIACANIINLLLARAVVRQKEIGVRLCLGASRGRLVRQLLTESFLLAGLGGGAGLLLAWASVKLLAVAMFSARGVTNVGMIASNLNPDVRVLLYTFLLSVVSAVACGLVPALRATRTDLATTIKDDGASVGQRLSRSRLRHGLVVAQVAVCLVLLIGAGLLLRGVVRAGTIDPGFETRNLLRIYFELSTSGHTQARGRQFHQELAARLESLPGVQSVSRALRPPLIGRNQTTINLPGEDVSAPNRSLRAFYNAVTPNYFETVGIPIVRGRGFTADEMRSEAAVVVVTESTARNLWPNQEPLGKVLRVEPKAPVAQVIGVARDAQNLQLGETDPLYFYVPLASRHGWEPIVLVRASGDTRAMQSLVRGEIQALDPTVWLTTGSLEDDITGLEQVGITRMASVLGAVLGLLALLLAALGIYGVMAYSVTQRTREIGIRLALGAQRSVVLKLVIKQGMVLVLIGVSIGLIASLALAQVMGSLLFGLSPLDPVTFVSVSLFAAAVALLACYIPARRGAKLDPMVALRYE